MSTRSCLSETRKTLEERRVGIIQYKMSIIRVNEDNCVSTIINVMAGI